MSIATNPLHPLHLLHAPYRTLAPVPPDAAELRAQGRRPGSALVWQVEQATTTSRLVAAVRNRPGGLALLMVLPPAERMADAARLIHLVEDVRPVGVLPNHETDARDLAQVLRRPPEDLPMEVTEYLRWRGIAADRETVHLLRRTVELSGELRSVSALSRSLYLSRRALGRRFLSRGLPVPSHWLQFARLLRVVLRLQNSDDSVLGIGYQLGYPDGFSLSNQMVRLTGHRPSDAREYLGWEWFMEAWLRKEAESGGLSPECTHQVLEANARLAGAEHGRRRTDRRRSDDDDGVRRAG